ncbi:hypothetical protein MAR_002749 [Mya arenaria]|uniref:Uncharacterized protein n=1 Tax=Mya arenaria TaxID=6604 RepID=A0ABY7G803_MYAAR|nr:hypothetical protein MAR_002749 [Mya arenaria]
MQDELTKNHRNDKESTSECYPVLSFEKYLSKLNAECNRLWQKSRDCFLSGDDVWYCNMPVGEKKLKSKHMTTLRRVSELSQIYTNHSIRPTGATILSKNMFGPAQVMAVTSLFSH